MINVGIGEFIVSCGNAVNELWVLLNFVDHGILIKAGIVFGTTYVLWRLIVNIINRSFSSEGYVIRAKNIIASVLLSPFSGVELVINKTISGVVVLSQITKSLFTKKAKVVVDFEEVRSNNAL